MNHGLLLFFNHPFRKVRPFLQEFYRERFAKIHVLTPPESSAANSDPDVTYFYHGSYNFGGAFSYLLNRPDLFAGMDWITILHDDVLINPAFPQAVEPVLSQAETLSPPRDPNFHVERWPWDARMIARAFFPRHPIMGDGNDSAREEMKGLYGQSPGLRADPTQFKMVARDLFNPAFNGALARWMRKKYGTLTADFGVPLSKANSDFFMVRRDKFNALCHYSGVLTRCGLFAEVAIPTALRWLAKKPAEFAAAQLDWSRGTAEEDKKHFSITRIADIPAYFERHPGKLAIHPIKVSKII